MPAGPLPFRLLSPAEFALLTAAEKIEYLGKLTLDVQRRAREFKEGNKRLVDWLLHKDDEDGK